MKRTIALLILFSFVLVGCAKQAKVAAPAFVPPQPPVSIEQSIAVIANSNMEPAAKERAIGKLLEEVRQMYVEALKGTSEQGTNIKDVIFKILEYAGPFFIGRATK